MTTIEATVHPSEDPSGYIVVFNASFTMLQSAEFFVTRDEMIARICELSLGRKQVIHLSETFEFNP